LSVEVVNLFPTTRLVGKDLLRRRLNLLKKTCVACGNTGNIPHRVNVGGIRLVVCGACLSEASRLLSLSAGDPPVTVVAKLLALRNPRKVALAMKRMQNAGVEVPWQEVLREAEFFRAQVRQRREEIQTEATVKRHAWLDELVKFLEKKVESRGLEWEIHDWIRTGKNTYIVKIGIYPWGTTFLEGTLDEIQECVLDIVGEVESARWRCPFCGVELGWHEVTVQGECMCGARFRQSTCRSVFGSAHENNVWEEIEERILSCLPEKERELYSTLINVGVRVEDLFENVAYLGKVFGWPTYVVQKQMRAKPKEEIFRSPTNALRVVLWEAGFSPCIHKLSRRRIDWWGGEVAGVKLYVCPSHPDYRGVVVRVEIQDVPLRKEWLSLPFKEADELYEAWTEWLIDNGDSGDYTVTDSLRVDDHEWSEGFIWKSQGYHSLSTKELRKVLEDGLEVYKEKVKMFLSVFSGVTYSARS